MTALSAATSVLPQPPNAGVTPGSSSLESWGLFADGYEELPGTLILPDQRLTDGVHA